MSSQPKNFVLDTSVLLYDAKCFEKLQGNNIYIPMVVLEEIDKFKSREGILGENAREVNRFLDELRSKKGNLRDGIFDEETNVNISVLFDYDLDDTGFKEVNNDNIIIATAKSLHEKLKVSLTENNVVTVITKDINLRVKCDAVKILANDYYADYEFIKTKKENDFYQGYREEYVDENIINGIYSSGKISLEKSEIENLNENEFVIMKCHTGQSALGIKKLDAIDLVKESSIGSIKPKNKDQIFALNLLLDNNIPLVTLTGVPGSGKTFLALMTALKDIENKSKQRIIFTRPVQTVGKDIGYLPGTLNEKMAPWLAPIVDNFRNQFGDLSYFELMMEKGVIDVAPLSYIRGRSFNDSIIIVDEAQNATVHELKTVITRTGKNSKIILLGDIEQIDLPYVNQHSNGLTIVIEKLKEDKLTGHINFKKGYRSELANLVAEKL